MRTLPPFLSAFHSDEVLPLSESMVPGPFHTATLPSSFSDSGSCSHRHVLQARLHAAWTQGPSSFGLRIQTRCHVAPRFEPSLSVQIKKAAHPTNLREPTATTHLLQATSQLLLVLEITTACDWYAMSLQARLFLQEVLGKGGLGDAPVWSWEVTLYPTG